MEILIITILISAAILGFAYYAYWRAFYYPPAGTDNNFRIPHANKYAKEWDRMQELMSEIEALPYEQVYITSFDGLKLAARYYQGDDSLPLHIQFHGYRGTATKDFCGGHKLARETGASILLIDQRSHGLSEGQTITFGINESRDGLSWIEYCLERFGKDRKIIIEGISMGAATVLMMLRLNLPDNVIAVTADCPFTSVGEILRDFCKGIHLPPKIMWPFLYLGARIYGHFNPNETNTVDCVKNAHIPILLIHGEADLFVPCHMGRKIADACKSNISFHTFPDAGHGLSFIVDEERYRKIYKDFINKVS